MGNTKYVIIDYSMGNLFSVQRMFHSLGAECIISADPDEIRKADKLILPGVGAFAKAMEELESRNIDVAIKDYVKTGNPLLGICLGMQLFFTGSEEFGAHKGLGLIPGKVVRFSESDPKRNEFKIPQIGWNNLRPGNGKAANWNQTILESLDDHSYCYFVHSFICYPENAEDNLAETTYGNDTFCSVTHKDNIWGCQFHPEKSAETGSIIIKNFIEKI